MSKPKLPAADDWQLRTIDTWNVKTFHAYLIDLHKKTYGLPYVPFQSWKREQGMMKNFINEMNDNSIIKEFIDICFKEHKVSTQYPTLSFGFCYTYKRTYVLPKVYAAKQQEEKKKKYEAKPKMSIEDMLDSL